ncbi:integrase core domain-containing protein [Streptomyces sp. NPDC057910]|uniref:integrase core domain-containing protein n=1 Tax=Streptomyces sp. NPDC057910 TaxID=3346278 RepID=UPI0036F09CD3
MRRTGRGADPGDHRTQRDRARDRAHGSRNLYDLEEGLPATDRPRRHPVPLEAEDQQRQSVLGEPVQDFKTVKYAPDYPERFDSPAHARDWFDAFISYYNHEHRHSGIGLHTPASVHFGTADQVRDQRAVALAEAFERHPERFARRPRPPQIPAKAWTNDPARRSQPEPQAS